MRGGAELRQHLAELGFVEGAEVKVISRVNGDCIVSVKGARLALNRTMSSHVMVTL
ncbi:FeoA family protein [Paratractidigestivibacter faecalis]|uniref:FeoA family protein n=1 Tax=Paratractidigestivibacter faecalis TaxID=2292441 RepID=UPI003AF7A996